VPRWRSPACSTCHPLSVHEGRIRHGGPTEIQRRAGHPLAGNRTKQVVNGGTPTFSGYGVSNHQLCWAKATTTDPGSACTAPSGATTYTTDANGNLTGSSAGFAASYNGFDQTTAITPAGGSALSPLTYGASTQVERRQAGSTDFTTSALGLGVADPSGGKATFYTRDPGGGLLGQRTSKDTQYDVLDALGSVVALTDSAGAVVGRYSYEPYGTPTFTGTVPSNFQFASGYRDPETGLLKFGARYYDPALGRWTQRDPLTGNLIDPRTINRYAYVTDDPINNIDLAGTSFFGLLKTVVIGFVATTFAAGICGALIGGFSLTVVGEALAGYLCGVVAGVFGTYITCVAGENGYL